MNLNQMRSSSSIKSNLLKSPAVVSTAMSSPKEDYDRIIIYLSDGWCTFPDLDNFDSDKLLRAFTLKENDSCDSAWDPSLPYTGTIRKDQKLSLTSLRQLEALFNLTQLLFGLSRSETVNYTFRDLQFRGHPRSFKKSGFKLIESNGRVEFYLIFEQLVKSIVEQGGLEIALLMYRTPILPMVRQKCLDLISNLATVPEVAYKILAFQSWLLDHLIVMIRDGDIISDKIPALSALIRLLKIMLVERMLPAYSRLVDMQYIDLLVDIFESPCYTEPTDHLPFFIKFEFIAMQSLTVILGDSDYSQMWSDKAKVRLVNYCMIVLLKAAGAYPVSNASTSSLAGNLAAVSNFNHIYYAEQHTNKHSLAHTLMTITELLRNDAKMKFFYRHHKPFKQLIIQLYKKYGAKSEFSRIEPGISYALNHLMRVLYIKNSSQAQTQTSDVHRRLCSNPVCHNEETKFKEFRPCVECDGKFAAYCSRKCLKAHSNQHLKFECKTSNKVGFTLFYFIFFLSFNK